MVASLTRPTPDPAAEPSTNDVRVAVVGCGYWGRNHVRTCAELSVLEALVDDDSSTVESLVAQHGGRQATLDSVLSDDGVRAIICAAPAATHYRITKRALEAGKHVLVEKPLALAKAEADELCAIADRNGLCLMVGHILQYHPAFIRLKELVQSGALGRLQYIYSNRLNLGKIRQEEDILWSFAPHDISMILSLLETEPDHVDATGGYYLNRAVADVTTTHLTFPRGEQAHVFVSWLHPFKEQKLVVVGQDGMAVFDDGETWDKKLKIYRHRVEWRNHHPVPTKAEPALIRVEPEEPLRQEILHFLECIRTGARPRTDGHEGARVLNVLCRASEVLRERQTTSAPPVAPVHQPISRVKGSHPGVVIHETSYVDGDVSIGTGSKIWHFSHILPNVKLGRNVVVGQNVSIGPDVNVGDNCKIQNNVSVYKGVTLEEGVFCGPSCVFTNVNNPRAEIERKSEFRPTLVHRGASIGANATIVCGHAIGEYAFIAAGAVVAADVPAFALMAGVPARRIGWMSRAGEKLGPDLVCPATGRRYREVDQDTLEEMI